MANVTIGDYLLMRLKELGIEHIFGVPGDYNLGLLDQVVRHPGMHWVGNCNELNAAYASDGYARIKGAGALVTTFGVGELSAINGIAGAYAEYVPIVHIVGLPTTIVQANQSIVHHSLGDGRFHVFANMYKEVTVAQTLLTQEHAAMEIDRVLIECWLKKRPVYIGLPSNVSYLTIASPKQPLPLAYPKSNVAAVNELAERAAVLLNQAKSPVVLIDLCAQRYPMKPFILDFLNRTGIPFASMNMGKGILDESHPQFIGNYYGEFSTAGLQEYIEHSDCIITFGSLLSDFNSTEPAVAWNTNRCIEIHSYYTKVKQSVYPNVLFCDVIPAVTKKIASYQFTGTAPTLERQKYPLQTMSIQQKRFWHQLSDFFTDNAIIIAETGTSMIGALSMTTPANVTYIAQMLWASIGYTLGALLGACRAAPERQAVLFIGDGAFQLTAQEVSTLLREGLSPTIFLLDNDGYTIERMIHGATMPYNDIQHWHYSALPKIFADTAWSATVKTESELAHALTERKKHPKQLALIVVVMEKMDAPEVLIKLGKEVSERNKYIVKEQ